MPEGKTRVNVPVIVVMPVVAVPVVVMVIVGPVVRRRRVVAFDHDGALLATAWDDNTVSIHDLGGDGPPAELARLVFAEPVTTLCFAPAGAALCVANGTPTVRLVDPQSGLDLRWLPHARPVRHVAFSAGATLVATADDGATVRVAPFVSSVDS